jgi:hypothetical protein
MQEEADNSAAGTSAVVAVDRMSSSEIFWKTRLMNDNGRHVRRPNCQHPRVCRTQHYDRAVCARAAQPWPWNGDLILLDAVAADEEPDGDGKGDDREAIEHPSDEIRYHPQEPEMLEQGRETTDQQTPG